MNTSEELVYNCLKYLGYENIIYEPDGNVPPDFLVDNRIAVEVRNLNQNQFLGEDAKGLDEDIIPLYASIKKLLLGFNPPTCGESWIVTFHVNRPLEPWQEFRPRVKRKLHEFCADSKRQDKTIFDEGGLKVKVRKLSKGYSSFFIMGGNTDGQADGWLLHKMEENILYCIREKSKKIEGYRSRYNQWWLILVDCIGYGLNEFERSLFEDQVKIKHNFDKLLIVSPRDATKYFEI